MLQSKNKVWNIIPVDEKYDCFLGNIISYAQSFSINYEMGLLGTWGFGYDTNNEYSIGEKINFNFYNAIENLKFFHGIKLNRYLLYSSNELENLLNDKLMNGPVIISVNTYYCPWCLSYKKYDLYHYILVVGIKNKKISFIDTYFASNNVMEIEIDALSFTSGIAFTFEKGLTECKNEDYICILRKTLKNIRKTQMINNLYNFKSDLISLESFDNELGIYKNDLTAVPIIVKLNYISSYRKNIHKALNYIGSILEHQTIFRHVSFLFDSLGIEYLLLKNKLIKQMIIGDIDQKFNLKKINAIIDLEKLCINEISDILSSFD